VCYSLWYNAPTMLPAGGTVKHISDNEIYLLIKYIKSVPWRVSKCLSYIEEARCLKVKSLVLSLTLVTKSHVLSLLLVI